MLQVKIRSKLGTRDWIHICGRTGIPVKSSTRNQETNYSQHYCYKFQAVFPVVVEVRVVDLRQVIFKSLAVGRCPCFVGKASLAQGNDKLISGWGSGLAGIAGIRDSSLIVFSKLQALTVTTTVEGEGFLDPVVYKLGVRKELGTQDMYRA